MEYWTESSVYNRPLSDSEILAIYQKGSAGKYDTSAPSIAQGLAEAQVTLNGTPQPVFFGNNITWQTNTITFTATQPSTPLQISGIEPGMLLDAFSLIPVVPTNGSPGDSLRFTNVANVIADHISASWSTNNLLSALNSSNVTVQWSIMSDSLYNPTNPSGYRLAVALRVRHVELQPQPLRRQLQRQSVSGRQPQSRFCQQRHLQLGHPLRLLGHQQSTAKSSGFTNRLNYACNYLIAGPDTAIYSTNAAQTNFAFWGGTTNTWIFQSNNIIDSDTNGLLNGADTSGACSPIFIPSRRQPFPLPPVPTDEAFIAYEKGMDFAGASLHGRDLVDANIVTRVRTQTGRLISEPPLSGLVAWWKGEGQCQ